VQPAELCRGAAAPGLHLLLLDAVLRCTCAPKAAALHASQHSAGPFCSPAHALSCIRCVSCHTSRACTVVYLCVPLCTSVASQQQQEHCLCMHRNGLHVPDTVCSKAPQLCGLMQPGMLYHWACLRSGLAWVCHSRCRCTTSVHVRASQRSCLCQNAAPQIKHDRCTSI
jgi:hypothetical protein